MNSKYPLAAAAGLIADPARASMMVALLDRQSLPAGELARLAGVSPQSASGHLSQLVEGGFLAVVQAGRHRYYSITSPGVAHAIESLGSISTTGPMRRRDRSPDRALCYARTCYDHVAGELGVQITSALQAKGFLIGKDEREYRVTEEGSDFLLKWGIDVAALRRTHRAFARKCLDWTERRHHLAGAVGAAVCTYLLEARWICRSRHSRAVMVTPNGREQLEQALGVRCRTE